MAQVLATMRKAEFKRVDKLQADLASFVAVTKALAEQATPELAHQHASAIPLALVARWRRPM